MRSKFPLTAVAFMVLASAICVQIDPIGDDNIFPFTRTLQFLGVEWNARLVLLALCSLGVAEALRARGSDYRTGAILMAIAGLLTVISGRLRAELNRRSVGDISSPPWLAC